MSDKPEDCGQGPLPPAGGGTPKPDRSPSPPDPPPPDDDALLAQCRVETFRAGGPGGQHQNTTDSGVRLTHRPTGITVTARESRSQHRNRKVALQRLRAVLEERARPVTPRIPTRVPKGAKQRRLEEKRHRSRIKRSRKKPEPEE